MHLFWGRRTQEAGYAEGERGSSASLMNNGRKLRACLHLAEQMRRAAPTRAACGVRPAPLRAPSRPLSAPSHRASRATTSHPTPQPVPRRCYGRLSNSHCSLLTAVCAATEKVDKMISAVKADDFKAALLKVPSSH